MIKFEGEHLLPGQMGHFLVITAFVFSLISFIYFSLSSFSLSPEKKTIYNRLATIAFSIQGISIFLIFAIVFYICSHHYYEYMYAYKHASKELEAKFLLACIWEGQEGSFLLWSIWHSILGFIFIYSFRSSTNKIWRAPVMSIISLAQMFLMLMILGIYFFNIRIGNSLFTLTRNEIPAPIFSQPNYLNFLKDGMGLNVLLRNYWMVIHPPILFLGFASTIIPAAFAYAGLTTKKYGDWVKPALPWTLMSACVLGVGIMMGGKWAYESLSFGGYWAWDPVENASLVPWLILIAGLHTMLIYKATGRSLKASYLFVMLTFSFILYSTFLTRTGILGDTSVHAFTEAGKAINVMLAIFYIFFTLFLLGSFIYKYKQIPSIQNEESTNSREFWMFIGAIILFLSALFIIGITSIPVYNKILQSRVALPEDPEFLYNKVMVMAALIIGLLTAISQYFKYKSTSKDYLLKKLLPPTFIAIIFSVMMGIFYPINFHKHGPGFLTAIYAALFASFYAVIANASYIFFILKHNFKSAGGSISHIGFTLMIAGMLISSGNKKIISDSSVNGINFKMGQDPMTKKDNNPTENLTLIRQVPTRMDDYMVTYINDSLGNEKGRKFYHLLFEKKNNQNKTTESFSLSPDVYLMKDNNMSSNPDTKSYLTKDIFTYISFAINEDKNTDTATFKEVELAEGDRGFYKNGYFILNKVVSNPNNEKYHYNRNDIALMADITFVSKDSMHYKASPVIEADSINITQIDDTVYAQNLFVRFLGIAEGKIEDSDLKKDKIKINIFIKKYDTGKNVTKIQELLINNGYFNVSKNKVPDGIFGKRTKKTVIKFQQDKNIKIDGIVGPETWDELTKINDKNKKIINTKNKPKIKIGIKESDSLIDFVAVKAYVFPYINLVWLGLIIMALGILLSMTKRLNWPSIANTLILIVVTACLFFLFLVSH